MMLMGWQLGLLPRSWEPVLKWHVGRRQPRGSSSTSRKAWGLVQGQVGGAGAAQAVAVTWAEKWATQGHLGALRKQEEPRLRHRHHGDSMAWLSFSDTGLAGTPETIASVASLSWMVGRRLPLLAAFPGSLCPTWGSAEHSEGLVWLSQRWLAAHCVREAPQGRPFSDLFAFVCLDNSC